MILGEIVSHVCGKIGRSDASFQALVRGWAEQRRNLIWQQALFLETLAIYTKAVAAGQHTVFLPSQIERIVAVRTGTRALLAVDQVFLFNANPELWDQTGTPMEFSRPSPSGVSAALANGGERLSFVSGNAADVGKNVSLYGELNGEEVQELLTLNGTAAVQTAEVFSEIFNLSKEATAGQITATGVTSLATLVRLSATQTEKRHPRIRLHETPAAALTLAVLAKRQPPPLKNDADSTGLDKLDAAVLAFTMGDALEKIRQYGKAATKVSEANAVLTAAKENAIYQEARSVRAHPEDSLGDTGFDADTY